MRLTHGSLLSRSILGGHQTTVSHLQMSKCVCVSACTLPLNGSIHCAKINLQTNMQFPTPITSQ
uniref:Uncharacterized protein n=1 Tax=Anguilla anguilla TaxID=7936 RepID=A0A0E9U1T7_ANGAN